MLVKPAERIQHVQEYYFSWKLKQIDELNKQEPKIINLGIGSPDQPPSDATIEALCKESHNPKNHGYQSYIGSPKLRLAFATFYKTWYNVELNPANEILPLIGSKEGIVHVSLAFLNQGDEVLVPNPGYPTYESAARLAGANIRYYDLTEENGYFPDFEKINQSNLSKVKMMWVNYPHMPTGTPGNLVLFEKIVEFGIRNKILICHDNPYSLILNQNPISIFAVPSAKNIALELNSLSKSHNMAGWRIGMVAADSEIIKCVLQVKSNMDSGMYLPLQMAAVEALNNNLEWYQELNHRYYTRKTLALKIFETLGCFVRGTQSGLFLWAKIPNSYKNGDEYSDEILEKARVFLTPGKVFGSNGDRHLRLSLCANEEVLTEALQRIKNVFEK